MSAQRCIDVVFSTLFGIPALFCVGIVYLIFKLKIKDGGPFLYAGERMGQYKEPFTIFKIRTLALNAEQTVGSNLLGEHHRLELPYGKFLRATRIDELPQLYNIFRGDMTFVGPRPLRQAVYQKNRHIIPNYDTRFLVKPGLTGISQLLTPHSTPKRLRALIDNRFILQRQSPLLPILLVAKTITRVLRCMVSESCESCRNSWRMYTHTRNLADRRRFKRRDSKEIQVVIWDGNRRSSIIKEKVSNISNVALSLASRERLFSDDRLNCMLLISVNGKRTKVARCTATIHSRKPLPDGRIRYVFFYEPVSNVNEYIVHKYATKQSMA